MCVWGGGGGRERERGGGEGGGGEQRKVEKSARISNVRMEPVAHCDLIIIKL